MRIDWRTIVLLILVVSFGIGVFIFNNLQDRKCQNLGGVFINSHICIKKDALIDVDKNYPWWLK